MDGGSFTAIEGTSGMAFTDHEFEVNITKGADAPSTPTRTSFILCATDNSTASYYHDLRIVDEQDSLNNAATGGRAWDRRSNCTRELSTYNDSTTYYLRVHADSIDEDSEVFEVEIKMIDGNRNEICGAGNARCPGTTSWTINNSGAMPKAWLSRFGREVAEQSVGLVQARMDAARPQGIDAGMARREFNQDTMRLSDLLLDSSFSAGTALGETGLGAESRHHRAHAHRARGRP